MCNVFQNTKKSARLVKKYLPTVGFTRPAKGHNSLPIFIKIKIILYP